MGFEREARWLRQQSQICNWPDSQLQPNAGILLSPPSGRCYLLRAMSRSDTQVLEAEYARLAEQDVSAPGDPERLFRMGEISASLERREEAARHFARAAQARGDWAPPCFALARMLDALDQPDAAITAYRAGLAIEPKDAETHFTLARLLERTGRGGVAIEHYDMAALYRPEWIDPRLYKGALLEGRGDYTAARQAYDRALALGAPPGFVLRRDLQVPIIAESAESYRNARLAYTERLAALEADPPPIENPAREAAGNRFFLAYHGLDDRPLQEGLIRLFRSACPNLDWTARHCGTPRRRDGPRRIAFASRFFHDHSIGRLMVGLLDHLAKRGDCELLVFDAVEPRRDDLRGEIERVADRTETLPADLEAARRRIADTEPDILFYPDIGMDPVTYFLAFARLAPVQCASWGHPVTTGMTTIDYFLSCDAAEPPDAEAHYTERLVRLGGLPFSYHRPAPPVSTKTRADFNLEAGGTLYFLAQNLFKIHPNMDEALLAILERDPTGLILLPEGQDIAWGATLRERFETTLAPHADRAVFLPRLDHDDYMRLLALSDVSLDSFPFSGGNTTYQALAMGTPVVTLPGDYLRGRLSLAIYHHLGVADCIARDAADYADIACRLGQGRRFREGVTARIDAAADRIFDDPIFLAEAEEFLMTAKPPRTT